MKDESKSLLDRIVADEELVITDALIRAFRINNCDPTCHCCGVKIKAGMVFKLAYVKTVGDWFSNRTMEKSYSEKKAEDEMLCQNCTAEDLIKYKEKEWRKYGREYEKRLNRGYTRKHVG